MLALGAAAGAVHAQTPDTAAAARKLAAEVARHGQFRIRLVSGSVVELREVRLEGTSLVATFAAPGGGPVSYPLGEVEQVWRRGSAAGRGFRIGAISGFIVGAIGGVAVTHLCLNVLGTRSCSDPSAGEQIRHAALGGVSRAACCWEASGWRWPPPSSAGTGFMTPANGGWRPWSRRIGSV